MNPLALFAVAFCALASVGLALMKLCGVSAISWWFVAGVYLAPFVAISAALFAVILPAAIRSLTDDGEDTKQGNE